LVTQSMDGADENSALNDFETDWDLERYLTATKELREIDEAIRDIGLAIPICTLQAIESIPDKDGIHSSIAWEIFDAAFQAVPEAPNPRKAKAFQKTLGLKSVECFESSWNGALLRQTLNVLVRLSSLSLVEVLNRIREQLEKNIPTTEKRRANQLREVESKKVQADAVIAQRQSTVLVPSDEVTDKIIRYEGHLHRQLMQTLHELERLQSLRNGEEIPKSQPVDVTVSIESMND
jgi:hypothetical protein